MSPTRKTSKRRGLMLLEYTAIFLVLALVCLSLIVYIGQSTAGGPPPEARERIQTSAIRSSGTFSTAPSPAGMLLDVA
ncbi:MAG: hypothetical protein D6741_07560 [Planctomycetota bacterium]|nr:MAG: hypothetical protein D6741_07560 [Planctomycetota bacterium]